MEMKLIVCTHKPYPMPSDPIYLPLHVGAALHEPIADTRSIRMEDGTARAEFMQGDDEGDNISTRNGSYCELTGLYWAWKNLHADVVGLVHYRRHFTVKSRAFIRRFGRMRSVLSGAELAALLKQYDILVPRKRRYFIESLYSHYAHTLDGRHLELAKEVIDEIFPEYSKYVQRVYRRTWGYMFNMMILSQKDLDEYCRWLFAVLKPLEERMVKGHLTQGMSDFERRYPGRVSEILFNVWLERKKAQGARIKEVGFLAMEPEQWHKKIPTFLKAKFGGKKYKESFA